MSAHDGTGPDPGEPELAPGGSAAATTGALAAALCGVVARASSGTWQDAAGAATQADCLHERLTRLAQTDQLAYTRARALLQRATGARDDAEAGDAETRDYELAGALHAAAAVPLTIAEAAADTASLAAWLADEAVTDMRADAAVAAALAEAGTVAAAHLVDVNLGVRRDDELAMRARAAVATALGARERALGGTG